MLLCQPKVKVARHSAHYTLASAGCWQASVHSTVALRSQCLLEKTLSPTASSTSGHTFFHMRPTPYLATPAVSDAWLASAWLAVQSTAGLLHSLAAFCCAQPLAPPGCCLHLLLMRPARPSPTTLKLLWAGSPQCWSAACMLGNECAVRTEHYRCCAAVDLVALTQLVHELRVPAAKRLW